MKIFFILYQRMNNNYNNMDKKDKLNLNQANVNFYWKGQDPKIAKIISVMEKVEHWVVDDIDAVSKELISIGKKMNTTDKAKLAKNSDQLIEVMAYITSGKALRLLNWLDENHSGLSFQYVMEARQTDDDTGKLLIDRLKTIKTLSLLNKVFSPSRTRLITELLKDSEKN
jgi:hypothetical protein